MIYTVMIYQLEAGAFVPDEGEEATSELKKRTGINIGKIMQEVDPDTTVTIKKGDKLIICNRNE